MAKKIGKNDTLAVRISFNNELRNFIEQQSDKADITRSKFVVYCVEKVKESIERKREKLTTKTEIDKIN
jgi:hypothetical protein